MLETLDASGLVAHAIGPGDRFYIALRKVRLIRQVQSGRRRRQLFATTRALRKRTGSLKILRDSQVRLQEGLIVEHNRTSTSRCSPLYGQPNRPVSTLIRQN